MRTESRRESSRAAITCPTTDLRTHPRKQITLSRVLTADVTQRALQPQGNLQSCLGTLQGLLIALFHSSPELSCSCSNLSTALHPQGLKMWFISPLHQYVLLTLTLMLLQFQEAGLGKTQLEQSPAGPYRAE